ncbi:hypothetical protein [Dolichospermum sp. UHCC 0260]|uniref:hypothetical protein n=1 Tax=Dolichospermum sp. UHCC 0260 TaxID=2590025 RepID=UPI0014460DFF|nr:hypothetical protein [Dolichospermum sp. UHCC 0260]
MQLTTNNCTGEAFGELFLAMTDNLSSKCFAPTNNCTGEAFGELFLAMTDNYLPNASPLLTTDELPILNPI